MNYIAYTLTFYLSADHKNFADNSSIVTTTRCADAITGMLTLEISVAFKTDSFDELCFYLHNILYHKIYIVARIIFFEKSS